MNKGLSLVMQATPENNTWLSWYGVCFFRCFFMKERKKIMAIQYDRIAKQIVEKTGGVDNIISAAHWHNKISQKGKN